MSHRFTVKGGSLPPGARLDPDTGNLFRWPNWRPIETAPRDGTPILLIYRSGQFKPIIQTGGIGLHLEDDDREVAYWRPDGMVHTRGVRWCMKNQPDGWLPLPEEG